jgi:hypothetical protein
MWHLTDKRSPAVSLSRSARPQHACLLPQASLCIELTKRILVYAP